MADTLFSAFVGTRWIATGALEAVVRALYPYRDQPDALVFEHTTGTQRDFDWRGTEDECVARLSPSSPAGPGRPKLGVVSAEVTLLPRHWDWLSRQPGKASATLRTLVERAMAEESSSPRRQRNALLKILWVLAGNEPDFEEATRSLTRGDLVAFRQFSRAWSGDLASWIERWLAAGSGAV